MTQGRHFNVTTNLSASHRWCPKTRTIHFTMMDIFGQCSEDETQTWFNAMFSGNNKCTITVYNIATMGAMDFGWYCAATTKAPITGSTLRHVVLRNTKPLPAPILLYVWVKLVDYLEAQMFPDVLDAIF